MSEKKKLTEVLSINFMNWFIKKTTRFLTINTFLTQYQFLVLTHLTIKGLGWVTDIDYQNLPYF